MVEEFDYNVSNGISFCLKGKQQRSQSPLHSEKKRFKPLELIHSDVCGKTGSKSLGGAEYFVTFIDDKARSFGHIQLRKKVMHSKNFLSGRLKWRSPWDIE